MFYVIMFSYFLLVVSIGFPPLFFISIPMLIWSSRKASRSARERRAGIRAAEQAIAQRAYYAELKRRANGGDL